MEVAKAQDYDRRADKPWTRLSAADKVQKRPVCAGRGCMYERRANRVMPGSLFLDSGLHQLLQLRLSLTRCCFHKYNPDFGSCFQPGDGFALRDVWQRLGTFLVVTSGAVLLASVEWSPGMLPTTQKCTGRPAQRLIQPQMSRM